MKGLLFFTGCFLLSITATAQRVFHVYETGMATLNADDYWRFGKAKPANLTFTIQNKVVRLNDRDKSTYHLKEMGFVETMEEVKSHRRWEAVDKNGQNCEFNLICFRSDTVRIQISYYADNKYIRSTFYNVTETGK